MTRRNPKSQTPAAGQREVIFNSYDREIRKGNMLPPVADLYSPAMLKLSKLSAERLERVASLQISQIEGVTTVRAARVVDTKTVYIYPVVDDPDGINVRWDRGNAWINLVSLLGPDDHLRSGDSRRFSVVMVEKSPVGPALQINLGHPHRIRHRIQE